MDKLEASLSGVSSTEITQIKADIAQLKIDVAAAAAAAAAAGSSSSGGASTDLTAISAQVATNTNDISTLDTKRQANEVKINDNVSKVSKLCDRVSYLWHPHLIYFLHFILFVRFKKGQNMVFLNYVDFSYLDKKTIK